MTSELRLALVGGAVERSPSPGMHRAALAAIGRRGDYAAVSVAAGGLAHCLDRLRADGVTGVNVTIPHKEAVVGLVQVLAPGAARAGAVNTLCALAGGWSGHNTDATGLARLLAAQPLDGTHAVILGAGGMARAAAVALGPRCRHITVANRDPSRAQLMVDDLQRRGTQAAPGPFASLSALALADSSGLAAELRSAGVLVNATSAGMHDPGVSPLPDGMALGAVRLVCDAVHTPVCTALLRQAGAAGVTVLDGLGLLAAQAADSFALWSGKRLPDSIFRNAATSRPSA
ncbi:MAG: shikimate dehydrogenase [Candidatus Dormibacteria bacterium]